MSIISALIILPFPFAANSALSATTANVIHGTAPYLTFDGGTPAANTESLLSIKLSNNATYAKRKSGEVGFDASNPIILPVANQTMADVVMNVPTTASSINLNTLIGAPNNYWKDDDGDGGITVTGTLSVVITDVNGATVGRSEALSASKAPYKVVLTSSAGTLTTQYGKPNVGTFDGGVATYYIKPAPYATFAQPNLMYGDNNNATGHGLLGYSFAGPTNQWGPTKGFKVQSSGINFPTTGSNNLAFNLTIEGATAQEVINTMTSTVEATPPTKISLALSVSSTNVLRVTLRGPKNGATAETAKFSPSTFKLKVGPTEIYSFTIGKWFIARLGGIDYVNTQTYCNTLNYRVPKRIDYTNSAYATGNDYGGNYTRAIGRGLFSEWGYTANNQDLYSSSAWEANYFYWASEVYSGSGTQYSIRSNDGHVGYLSPPYIGLFRSACVSP